MKTSGILYNLRRMKSSSSPYRLRDLRVFVQALFVLALLSTSQAQAAEPPRVAISISPLHSLVAGVMKDAGNPELLVKGGASPHSQHLRPSQMRLLSQAHVIFWRGGEAEGFLRRPLATAKAHQRIINLMELPDLTLLPARSSGAWELPAKPGGTDQRPEHIDNHIWLDPANAMIIVKAAAITLGEIDPEHATIYEGNAAQLIAKLKNLDKKIQSLAAPVINRPYLVFHDAYQYFEYRYGLKGVGAVTVDPERKPGARRLRKIQKKLSESGAQCIFSEPQFPSSHLKAIAGGGQYPIAELDPLGTDIPPGPDMYFILMHRLVNAFVGCLH